MRYQLLVLLARSGCKTAVVTAYGMFFVQDTKGYSHGDHALVRYNPDDQFAEVVKMEDVEKAFSFAATHGF